MRDDEPERAEDYTLRQAMPYPQHQRRACRDIKRSGAHDHTAALGAVYEEAGGWERPRYYAPEPGSNEPMAWRRTDVFDLVQAEALGVAERVGLGDFSAFAKFELSGPDAGAFLDRVCANRMPVAVGRTALTTLLNVRGTIEGEATLARTGDNTYWFVTGAPSERRVWETLEKQLMPDDALTLTNVTDDWGVLTVAGPRSRAVLGGCSGDDFTDTGFPWLRARTVTVAGIECLAMRMSFTGRLAWELHAPNDLTGDLWAALWAAGEEHGIVAFGSKAIDVLRMEKAYRGGHELTNDVSPLEVDLMRMVKPDGGFTGAEALAARAGTRRSTIAYCEVHSGDVDPLGGEAVLADGVAIGTLTSVAHSPTTGQTLAFVFIPPAHAEPGTRLQLSMFGPPVDLTVLAAPVFDPDNRVLRGSA